MLQANNLTLLTGTTELLITPSNARLVKIVNQNATTGTVTIREAAAIGGGSTAKFTISAADLTAGGKDFSANGVRFQGGLTIQLSVAGDQIGIIWAPNL